MLRCVQAFDLAVLRTLYAGTWGPFWVHLFGLFSFWGSGWLLIVLGPVFFVPSLRAHRPGAGRLLAMLGAASAIVTVMKALTARVRPCHAVSEIHALSTFVPVDPSFPSGHATGSFAFAAFVFAVHRGLGVLAILMAALVAWSRVALGVHYPSDVVVGALLGSAVGSLGGAWAKRGPW